MSEKTKVRIEQWQQLDAWGSQDFKRLCGHVYGHPNFRDGEFVFTSRIVGEQDGTVETLNTLYVLGTPADETDQAKPAVLVKFEDEAG